MSFVDNAKEIYEIIKKAANLDLQEKMVNLREEAVALQEENVALKTKVSELEEKLYIKENIDFRNGVYWLKEGDEENGPFCQKCYDSDGKLIRLQDQGHSGQWYCKTCGEDYYPDTGRRPQQKPRSRAPRWSR